jgi:hypothetical protein
MVRRPHSCLRELLTGNHGTAFLEEEGTRNVYQGMKDVSVVKCLAK